MLKNPNFKTENRPSTISQNYIGRDIKVFEEKSNWRPWQKTFYDLLFFSDGYLRIDTIIDEVGY